MTVGFDTKLFVNAEKERVDFGSFGAEPAVEECTSCPPPIEDEGSVATVEGKEKSSFFVAVLNALLHLPCFMGICSWPVLVSAIFSFTATSSMVLYSHIIGLILTVLSFAINCFTMTYQANSRRGYGPFSVFLVASPFVFWSPIVNLLLDYEVLPEHDVDPRFYTNPFTMSIASYIGITFYILSALWNASVDIRLLKLFHKLVMRFSSPLPAKGEVEFEKKKQSGSSWTSCFRGRKKYAAEGTKAEKKSLLGASGDRDYDEIEEDDSKSLFCNPLLI